MKNNEINSKKIASISSIIAIIICIIALIIEFINKRNDYIIWIALLLLNLNNYFVNKKK